MANKKDTSILNDIKSAIETIRNISDPAMRLAMIDALLATFGAILPNEALNVIQQARLEALNEYLNMSKSAKNEKMSAHPLDNVELGGLFEGLALNVLGGIKALSPQKAREIAANFGDFMKCATDNGMLEITNLIDKMHVLEESPKEKDIASISSAVKDLKSESEILTKAGKLDKSIRSAKREVVEDAKKGKKLKFSELPESTKDDIDKLTNLNAKAENLLNTKRKMTLNEEIASLRSELGDDDTVSFASRFFAEKKSSMLDKVIGEGKSEGRFPSKK